MRNILKRDRNPLSKGTSPSTFSTQNADGIEEMEMVPLALPKPIHIYIYLGSLTTLLTTISTPKRPYSYDR
jgi:hypothetical protein